MESVTKYVSWVAGLAVALGIWTWLPSVPWGASADPAVSAQVLPWADASRDRSGIGRERELHEFDGLRAGIDTGHLRVDPPPDHYSGVAGDTARAVGVIRLHHDRRHAGDRPGLDLILEEL